MEITYPTCRLFTLTLRNLLNLLLIPLAPQIAHFCTSPVPQICIEMLGMAILFSISVFELLLLHNYIKNKTPLKPILHCFSFFIINLFIYFWLCWVFVAAWAFSSCGERGLLFVAVHGLLNAVASLVVEHRL